MFKTHNTSYKGRPEWPALLDNAHGYVEGLRSLSVYNKPGVDNEKEIQTRVKHGYKFSRDCCRVERLWEGFDPAKAVVGPRPVFRALNISYDQCVMSNCDCLKERRAPLSTLQSVHYSCIIPKTVNKPGKYTSEDEFVTAVLATNSVCIKFWMGTWLEVFKRAIGPENYLPAWVGPSLLEGIDMKVIEGGV